MTTPTRRLAVVTGSSSGIGAATARALAGDGFEVVCAARRTDRIEALADEIGGHAVACDITAAEDVRRLADEVAPLRDGTLDVLVNNAGAAFDAARVDEADLDAWRATYEVNVIGTVRVTQALLPLLVASRNGLVVTMGSTAGRIAYQNGGGYTAAKHAIQVVNETLRLELVDQPVRFTEIAPGMVKTDEFSTLRFGGDEEKAAAVYAGVAEPLVAEDVAEAIRWVTTLPRHVNVDEMVLRPKAQAAHHVVHRVS